MQVESENQSAVFLHGGWRCSSTYVWSRFRQLPSTLCFYEPFGEELARCTLKRIRGETPQSWASRHPPLTHAYRYEYRPLLRRVFKGVRGYRESFALAEYFPVGTEADRAIGYLARLAACACGQGRRPVFGFSRSLGRAATLKQALGGYHIVIRRNPLQQWLSCRTFRARDPLWYFELCHFLILALAPAGSAASRFGRELGLPPLPQRGLQRQLRILHGALHPWSDELSYRAFTAVSLLSYALAEPAADLVLDVDRLGGSEEYRRRSSARIAREAGLDVDFNDCRVPRRDLAGLAVDFRTVEQDVRERLVRLGADLAPDRSLQTAAS